MFTILTDFIKCPLKSGSGKEVSIQVKRLIPKNCTENPMVVFVTGNEHALFDSLLEKTWRNFGSREDTIIIIPEHRGYGKSITDEPQHVTEYVTPENALTDYKIIFDIYRKEYKGKWIVSGVSYGGGLSIAYSATYPEGIDVVHSSSGVVNWPAMMPEYDIGAKEVMGEEMYEQLCVHMDNLVSEKLFDQNWFYREMVYALTTSIVQIRRVHDGMKESLRKIIELPTDQFIQCLLAADQKLGGLMSQYANANRAKIVSKEELATGTFDWRVWRYQQFTSVGTLWAPAFERSIYRNNKEDWNAECKELFGFDAPIFNRPSWDVKSLASKIKVPMVITHGKHDPWRRLGLDETFTLSNGGEFIIFDDSFHSPETDEGSGNGIKVMNAIITYL